MKYLRGMFKVVAVILALGLAVAANAAQRPNREQPTDDEAACKGLLQIPNLTILSADLGEAKGSTPEYFHVTGLIAPAIRWHVSRSGVIPLRARGYRGRRPGH